MMSRQILCQVVLSIFCFMSATKAMDSHKICATPFTHGSEGKFEEFKHLEAYRISDLHAKGLRGQGYKVSIIEDWADPQHPALQGKIELLNPMEVNPRRGGGDSTSRHHGNHVSALIVGNKTDQFDGGVAPEAHGYIFWPKMEGNVDAVESQVLKLFRAAAKQSHIINLSGAIVEKGNKLGLSHSFLNELSNILEESDAVLIISASNGRATIGEEPELKYLVDLVEHLTLAKRVLIVGNLGYVSEEELKKEQKYLSIWENNLLPKLKTFKLDEKNMQAYTGKESPWQLVMKNEPSIRKQLRQHCFTAENEENSDLVAAYDFLKVDELYVSAYAMGLTDSKLDKTDYVIHKVNENKIGVPDDVCMSGKPTSTLAGIVKNHFIMAYGTNIRSAWDSKEGYEKMRLVWRDSPDMPKMELFANKTGSSQSVPITTGILILLHQHLYKSPDQKGSWGTLLETVKKSSRKIGTPEVSGLGVLDTTKLFSDVLVSHSKEKL